MFLAFNTTDFPSMKFKLETCGLINFQITLFGIDVVVAMSRGMSGAWVKAINIGFSAMIASDMTREEGQWSYKWMTIPPDFDANNGVPGTWTCPPGRDLHVYYQPISWIAKQDDRYVSMTLFGKVGEFDDVDTAKNKTCEYLSHKAYI